MPHQPLTDVTRNGLRARVAVPETKGRAGVLVLPSAAGIGDQIGRILAGLAAAGLTALAWDPFASFDASATPEQKSKYTDTQQRDSEVFREHVDWLSYLQSELGASAVATLGFCMGGRMSLLAAAQDPRIKAAVAFYPTLRDPRPETMADPVPLANAIACPVLIHYPGKDHLTSQASFARLRSALEARPGPSPTTVFYHPHAHHGFMNRADEKGDPDGDASAVAWAPTVAFLGTILGAAAKH